jgi:hypothetical protein
VADVCVVELKAAVVNLWLNDVRVPLCEVLVSVTLVDNRVAVVLLSNIVVKL